MAKQTKGGLQRFAEGNRVKKGKGMAALNVLGRIGSDADTAMATRRMGNTQFGDVGPSTQGIIKDVGGNWVPAQGGPYKSELERQLGRLKRGVMDETPAQVLQMIESAKARGDSTASLEESLQRVIKRDAANKFVDSNLKNYITKQMATEADPVRKLAEQGITAFPKTEDEYGDIMLRNYGSHTSKTRRDETGFPKEGVAKSKLAKHYETLSDEAISPRKAKRYQQTQALPFMQRPHGFPDMPWVNKLDPESHLYQLSDEADFEKLGFNHIMDVLRADLAAGRIRPEQLNKMSMEQAVRRTHEYDAELARKMLEARQKEMGEAEVFKDYPEGYKWVQLKNPGQFALESDTMGHSVRGYEPPKGHPDWIEGSGNEGHDSYGFGGYEGIKSGKAKIYSLRDPKGMSHATIEVGPQNFFDFNKWWEKQPKELKDEINARARRGEHSGSIYEAPEYIAAKEAMPPMISQIKGKQNAAPNEQYLPYIQDFVKSGDFSEVREIQNAGLMDAQKMIDPTTYAKYVENKLEVPKYATEAELEKIHNEYLKLAEPQNAKPEFAKGGNVSHSHHYYQIARDFGLPHLSEGGEVLEGEGHERHGLIQDLYATIADFKAKNKPKDQPKKFDKGGYAFQDPMSAPDSALSMDQQEYAQAFKDAARDAYYNDKRNMVTPKGKKQFGQQVAANVAGIPVDLANMLAGGLDATVGAAAGKMFPSLSKPVSVLDPNGEKVFAYPLSSDKPRRGSADLVERLGHDYEFYSAPLAAVGVDLATGMAGPAARMAGRGARMLESGANKGYSAAQRPFTPATMTIEATAPDLGQRTSMGYRQGLNDRLISSERGGTDLSNIGGRPTTRREGQGAWMGSQGFETNPLAAIDVPRAGDLSKNAEFRRAMAQAGTNLNQEGMAAHRFLPNLTSNPNDASAMLIKPKKGALSNEQVVGLAKELGNRMVVAHNPRLGGVVVHPFGEAAEGDKFIKQARAKARKVLGDDASIKYGRADINKDRAFMMGADDYAGAGATPPDESVRQVREMLKRQSREAFPNGDAPTGGVQPWSIGENYPTHVQGIGNGERVDYRPVNYATGEIGRTVPTYAEAEVGRGRMLNDHHRSLPKRIR